MATDKVKINFCAPRELLSLPGIGRSLCDAILDLRESKGNIKLEDLAQVKHLQLSLNLVERLDFEPYEPLPQASPTSDSSRKTQDDMLSRVDQAIASSNLRGPPSCYLTPPTSYLQKDQSTTHPAGQPASGYGPLQGFTTFNPVDPAVGPSGHTPWGYGGPQQSTHMGAMSSPQNRQPYSDFRKDQAFGQLTSQPNWGQSGVQQTVAPSNLNSFYPTQPVPLNVMPSNSFQQTMSQNINPTSLVKVKTEPGQPTACPIPQFSHNETSGQTQACAEFAPASNQTKQQSKADWLPKSLYFDPNKTTWEAFYLKFHSYARDKHWSSQECKSKLMYVLEGKAAEFFASLHEREPNLPFFDVVSRMESRFAFRELQETSLLAFMNCSQNKDEKVEEWADRVLTLATKAFKNLPDEHIHKQAVLRFCHGSYDKSAGMHAANKMPSRIEEAIDCIKWFQYNHQIFQDKGRERKSVHLVGEDQSYSFPDSNAWSTSLQDRSLSVQNREGRGRQRERYVSYKGPRQESPSEDKKEEKKESSKRDGKDIEERVTSLEGMFQQLMQKLDAVAERGFNRSSSPSRMATPLGRSESPSRCFACNAEGHFKRDCPKRKQVSFKVEQVDTEDLNNSGSDLEA